MYASGNMGWDSSHDYVALPEKYFVKYLVREKGKFKYLYMYR